MRKFQRVNQPDFLVERWEAWGMRWERRLLNNPGARFNWPKFQRKPVNQLLLPHLKEQTQDHCSFCDIFPVSPPSDDTIEHFRPKSLFPKEVCRWDNLYYCCRHCQKKLEEFDEDLLRPDDHDYDFDKYFRWDFILGTLEVNGNAPLENQKRAEVTIRLYRLNVGHPTLRKLKMRPQEPGSSDYAYRHYDG